MENINDYGKVVLNNKVFKEIAEIAALKIKGAYPYKKNDFVACKLKDDILEIKINLKVKQDSDVVKICSKVQNKVRESIFDATGLDCESIDVDVLGFVKE